MIRVVVAATRGVRVHVARAVATSVRSAGHAADSARGEPSPQRPSPTPPSTAAAPADAHQEPRAQNAARDAAPPTVDQQIDAMRRRGQVLEAADALHEQYGSGTGPVPGKLVRRLVASLHDRKKMAQQRHALLRLYFTMRKRPGFLLDNFVSNAVVDVYTFEVRVANAVAAAGAAAASPDATAQQEPPAAVPASPYADNEHFMQILADISDAGLRTPPQALRECCYRLLQAGLADQALSVFELLVQQYTQLPPYSDLMAFVLSRNPDLPAERLRVLMNDARRAGVPPPYSAHRALVLAMASEGRTREMLDAWEHMRQCKMRPDEDLKGAFTEELLRAGELQLLADMAMHQPLGYVAAEKLMRWSRVEYARDGDIEAAAKWAATAVRILEKEGTRIPVGYQASAAVFAARLGRTGEAAERIATLVGRLPSQASVWTEVFELCAAHRDADATRSIATTFLEGESAVGVGRRTALAAIRALMLLDLDDEAIAFAEAATKKGILVDSWSLAALRKYRDRRRRFVPPTAADQQGEHDGMTDDGGADGGDDDDGDSMGAAAGGPSSHSALDRVL